MSQRIWQESGSAYKIAWGGLTWLLELDQERPGLRPEGHNREAYLCLEGLGAAGRRDARALCGETLVGAELVRARVEATFAPTDWGGLRLRASWSPTPAGDGIDLEIQVSASSVGQLCAVEVFVASRPVDLGDDCGGLLTSWAEPRDRRSAALSYDGREPLESLRRLSTLPLAAADESAFPPVVLTMPSPPTGRHYLEMVHPHDVARRILVAAEPPHRAAGNALAACYGLLGHDLERGVVVRGRLRGLWIADADLDEAARAAFREFLAQPPPLGT